MGEERSLWMIQYDKKKGFFEKLSLRLFLSFFLPVRSLLSRADLGSGGRDILSHSTAHAIDIKKHSLYFDV